MASSNFIDHVRICCRSGKGGDGFVHFHRDKFTAKGGPDGGDGARGGHIILRGNQQYWTLLHLRYRKQVIAQSGEPGGISNKSGANGKDEILNVPLGTVVKSIEPDQKLYEIVEDGQQYVVARGGKGGLGNTHFKSSTNQTPRYAEPGEAGDEIWVILELKLLADVGLVGFPNAGKSTLLSVLSAARPQIADYPFTTTRPNLGVVPYRGDLSFVMADVPGLLEGAHEGKGLGTRFLRHIERNALLLFVISAETLELQNEYETLLGELEGYDTQLLRKKRVLAISKADMLDDELKEALQPNLKAVPHVFISSVTGAGILELKRLLWQKLHDDGNIPESSEK